MSEWRCVSFSTILTFYVLKSFKIVSKCSILKLFLFLVFIWDVSNVIFVSYWRIQFSVAQYLLRMLNLKYICTLVTFTILAIICKAVTITVLTFTIYLQRNIIQKIQFHFLTKDFCFQKRLMCYIYYPQENAQKKFVY